MSTPITAWCFYTVDTDNEKTIISYYQAKQTGMDRLEEISKRHGTTINQDAIGTRFWCTNASESQMWGMEVIKLI